MSLHSNIYWTKRVLVVFSLLLFICSGIRIFQITSKLLIKPNINIGEQPAQVGYGKLPKLGVYFIQSPPSFSPSEFKERTLAGHFQVTNGYPREGIKKPIANVYKVEQRTIDSDTTEIPRKISHKFGFTTDPEQLPPTRQVWKESNKELDIDGQYLAIQFKNIALTKLTVAPDYTKLSFDNDSEAIKKYFENTLTDYNIGNDFTDYKFSEEYVDFDTTRNEFVPSANKTSGQYLRLNAVRQYPVLSKSQQSVITSSNGSKVPAKTEAVYPHYNYSNNYLVVTGTGTNGRANNDILVEMGLYNWPVNQKIETNKDNVMTYDIKTAKEAFEELKTTNKYLVGAYYNDTKRPVDSEFLAGIKSVTVNEIEIKMYEDTINTSYIQPVYVFNTLAVKDNKTLSLVYIVPAVSATDLVAESNQ